ncbi:MAG TPA: cation diffusion facilitator family transporter [Chloroflexia bacterium]|nr:cation diffusion facilitator family transporter [Chloroflexia bacterium]
MAEFGAQLDKASARAEEREQTNRRRKRAARVSVFSNTLLILAKLAVGLSIGSISVLSEAIHSSVDLLAAVIALMAVRIAARPADKSHPYGHGKFENLSGTIESLLIFAGAGIIIFEALQKFGHNGETEAAFWGVLVMGASASVNFGVSRYLYKVAHETDSIALKADAAHLQTDVTTSLGVFVGLALVWLTGWSWLDPLTALAVALLIIKAGWEILLHSVGGLLDAGLPVSEEEVIRETIQRFSPQFINYHELRTRQSGPERHIDFHLVVPDTMTALEAHRLCDNLEESLDAVVNGAIIQIHVEPHSICHEEDGVFMCSPARSITV